MQLGSRLTDRRDLTPNLLCSVLVAPHNCSTNLQCRNAVNALILGIFFRACPMGKTSDPIAGSRLVASPAPHVLPTTQLREVGGGALVQGWGKRLKTRK